MSYPHPLSGNGLSQHVLPGTVPETRHLQQPFNDTSLRGTPDVSPELSQKLQIESSEDDETDSMTSDTSDDEDDYLVTKGLPTAKKPTGLCYDERMRYHSEVSAISGENVHPEDPRRIYYIMLELMKAALVADYKGNKPLVEPPLRRIDAREATEDECRLIHTEEHWNFVKRTEGMFGWFTDAWC